MGQLLALLKNKSAEDVFIDFQNVEPTDAELKIYNQVDDVLGKGQDMLQEIENYTSATAEVKNAIEQNNREAEEKAFVALLSRVESIALFHQFTQEVEQVVPPLLRSLAEPTEEKKQSLADQQALAKQLALIFDLALQFDWVRLNRPHLSNDFAYYRRLLPKFARHEKVTVKEEDANRMALFTSQHIPMMTSISKATSSAIQQNQHITDALAVMAVSCMKMVKSRKFENAAVNLLCMRAMTGAIILYDHVDPLGAFHKNSPIPVKQCVQLLLSDFPDQKPLLNAMQFSSLHFNDSSTPNSLRDLFD